MKTLLITEDNMENYEGIIPEEVAENLIRDTFCGIAVQNEYEEVMASMVFEINNSQDMDKDTTSRLNWLFSSDPQSGEAMFSKYGAIMKSEEAKKSFVELKVEGSEDLIDLLKDADFSFSEIESEDIVVTVKDFAGLDIAKKKKVPSYIRPLKALDERQFKRGLMNCIFHTKRELTEDLVTLPMEWFDPELSCYIQTDERINGLLLVHGLPTGVLRVELMTAYGPDSKTDLIYMIRFSIFQAVKLYQEDTNVMVKRYDKSSRDLMNYFFPRVEGKPCMYGERNEAVV